MPPKAEHVNSFGGATPDALDRLAAEKHLDPQTLRGWGVEANGEVIFIPYRDELNDEMFRRRRNPPGADKRFHQPSGKALAPYGLWRLHEFRSGVKLHILEGESDSWAMWSAELPALGIPGSAPRCLTFEHLIGFDTIYLHQENDNGGVRFIAGMKRHLINIGYECNLFVLTMPDGCKDIGDVFVTSETVDDFRDAVTEMEIGATPVLTRAPPKDDATTSKADDKADEKVGGFVYAPMTTAQLLDVPDPEWLIEDFLVAGQPGVVGGPLKTFKTSIGLDLAISLAEGTPFLGRFRVPKKRRVAVISGESGQWTIGQTVRRVCGSREIDPRQLPIEWHFDLPKLTSETDMAALCAGLAKNAIEIVLLDPLYLCLLGGGKSEVKAENLYQIGPLLLNVSRACMRAGTTPLLFHHSTKPNALKFGPPTLTDLAFAGIGEFARQWIMLGWREKFDPDQTRKLWISANSSVGQASEWALDIHEGKLGTDFKGRTWEVDVYPASEVESRKGQSQKGRAGTASAEDDAEKERKEEVKFLESLDDLDKGKGAVYRKVITAAKMSDAVGKRVLKRLVSREVVEEIPDFQAEVGNGGQRDARGIRRRVTDPFGDDS